MLDAFANVLISKPVNEILPESTQNERLFVMLCKSMFVIKSEYLNILLYVFLFF